jgi:spermidine synthase
MDLLSNLVLALGLEITPAELLFGLVGCGVAMGMGVFLAKKQARAFKGEGDSDTSKTLPAIGNLPKVNYFDYGDLRFLHLGSPAVQGSMKISKPFEIHLEYVQRMMAWMLFTDLDRVSQRTSMQLGLGAASLTKFCHLQLGMQTTAIELNPQVIAACRLWFHLPHNNETLQVLQGDAAQVSSDTQWHRKIDALQVDLYDPEAARPAVDSERFYRDCRELLSDDGCMSVNLFGRDLSYPDSLKKITSAFGADAVWTFKPTSAGNTIVLALRTPRRLNKQTLQTQAQIIEARWPLPATQWLKEMAISHADN